MVRNFQPFGYPADEPICPDGMSVIVNAPAAYRFTSAAAPERHFAGLPIPRMRFRQRQVKYSLNIWQK